MVVDAVTPFSDAVMLPTPATVPEGVKRPEGLMLPSSPRSIDHVTPLAGAPPDAAVKGCVGTGEPVTTVRIGLSGAIVIGPWVAEPSGLKRLRIGPPSL